MAIRTANSIFLMRLSELINNWASRIIKPRSFLPFVYTVSSEKWRVNNSPHCNTVGTHDPANMILVVVPSEYLNDERGLFFSCKYFTKTRERHIFLYNELKILTGELKYLLVTEEHHFLVPVYLVVFCTIIICTRHARIRVRAFEPHFPWFREIRNRKPYREISENNRFFVILARWLRSQITIPVQDGGSLPRAMLLHLLFFSFFFSLRLFCLRQSNRIIRAKAVRKIKLHVISFEKYTMALWNARALTIRVARMLQAR